MQIGHEVTLVKLKRKSVIITTVQLHAISWQTLVAEL
jgi:hypothetical protein